MLSSTLPSYYVKLGFISDSRESFKSTSPFKVIVHMWLALFSESLQKGTSWLMYDTLLVN